MRRPLMIFLIAALVGAAGALPAAAAEGSNTPDPAGEQDFLSRINNERTSRGRRALSWHPQAASVARAHSEDMADDGDIYHNDRLGSQMSNWAALGENVGVGPSVSAIHGAFMGSTAHRANILGNFTHVGVGVVERDGSLWVTEVFVTPQSSSGSGGSSAGSGDDEPRPKAERASGSSSSRRTVATPPRVRSARRSPAVRAANAAPVHRVPPPVDVITGERTVAALERFALDEAIILVEGCLPREAC